MARAAASGDIAGVRELASNVAQQVRPDVQHPLAPGYTLLDALALLSLGGAGVLRVPRAVKGAREAPRAARPT